MINIYTFDVYIISGPMSEKFVEDNQVILRKIEIRGDQLRATDERGLHRR